MICILPRKVYARWAQIVAKMRHLWLDVMQTQQEWRTFARQLKGLSAHRPAMREEFDRVFHDWDTL